MRRIRLASGEHVTYDALILAVGAWPVVGLPGALVFRDQRDLGRARKAIAEALAERGSHLAFAVTSRRSWPLPAYELAMLAAAQPSVREAELRHDRRQRREVAPRSIRARASELVAALLEQRGISFIGSAQPRRLRRDGAMEIDFGAAVSAKRVIAMPELRGRRIPGIPASWLGFTPVDGFGRVEGLDHVYAAGDMTTFPIKHGSLATQEADVIAQIVAGGLGQRFTNRARTGSFRPSSSAERSRSCCGASWMSWAPNRADGRIRRAWSCPRRCEGVRPLPRPLPRGPAPRLDGDRGVSDTTAMSGAGAAGRQRLRAQ